MALCNLIVVRVGKQMLCMVTFNIKAAIEGSHLCTGLCSLLKQQQRYCQQVASLGRHAEPVDCGGLL